MIQTVSHKTQNFVQNYVVFCTQKKKDDEEEESAKKTFKFAETLVIK